MIGDLDETAKTPPKASFVSVVLSHPRLLEACVLSLALLIFLVSVLPNLASYPVLTDDEMWVLSSAYKLAQQGVFGSDMFAGFYNADQHYYFNMPAHHLVIAGALKLLGAGLLQARLVGIVYGVATLLLTYLLARRVHGVPVAILTLALLLFLRFNIGFDTGLPLQELAVNLRYDLAPLPFVLLGMLLLLKPPSLWRASAAGVLFGLATLLQFYGAFLIPVGIAFIWLEDLPKQRRLQLAGALVGAAVIVGLPYGAWVLAHFDDYKGQVSTVDERDSFTSPSFYIDNLLHEPQRFLRPLAFKEVPRGEDPQLVDPRNLSLQETLTRRPSAKLAVLVGLPTALAYLGWRGLRDRQRGDRLLFLCLAGLVVQFALLEQTKFYIYWILVVPFLCIGIAAAVLALWRRARASPQRRYRLAAGLVGLALLLGLAEGSAARLGGLRNAQDATSYDAVASAVHSQIPPGSKVVGSTSMWWALRDTDFRSYFLFFYVTRPDAGDYRNSIDGYLNDFGAEYLVLTQLGTIELQKHLAPQDYAALQNYLSTRGQKLERIERPEAGGYRYIDIWRLR